MRMFRKALLYFIGSILSKAASFFLIPLYTQYIPAEDLGIFDTSISIATFVFTIVFLDIGTGVMRWLLANDEGRNENRIITSGLQIYLCSLLLAVVMSAVACLFIPVEYCFFICTYGVVSTTVTNIGCMVRGNGKNAVYAASGVINTLVQVGLNILFILVFRMGYQSLYFAHIISGLISAVYLITFGGLLPCVKANGSDKKMRQELLSFCLPLGINSAAFWLLNSANRVIVTLMLGSEYTGYFTIANKFTQIVVLVSTCIQYAWQEEAFSVKIGDDAGAYFGKAFSTALLLYGGAIAFIICGIKAFLAIFPLFIGQGYADSVYLIPLALTASLASIMSSFLAAIFGAIKRNDMIFRSTLIGGIINVTLLFILIKCGVGVGSANIALIVGFGCNVLLRYRSLKKEIGLRTDPKIVVLAVIAIVSACLLYLYTGTWASVACLFAIALAFIYKFRYQIKQAIPKLLKGGK